MRRRADRIDTVAKWNRCRHTVASGQWYITPSTHATQCVRTRFEPIVAARPSRMLAANFSHSIAALPNKRKSRSIPPIGSASLAQPKRRLERLLPLLQHCLPRLQVATQARGLLRLRRDEGDLFVRHVANEGRRDGVGGEVTHEVALDDLLRDGADEVFDLLLDRTSVSGLSIESIGRDFTL